MARTTAYREAGADCLYVPGIADAETIGRLVKEVGAPVNVVKGLAGIPMSVNQLEDLGVKRVSVGGSLVRTTLGFIRRAPAEIRDYGTLGYAATAGAGFRPLTVLRRPPGYNGSVTDLRAMTSWRAASGSGGPGAKISPIRASGPTGAGARNAP